MTYEYMHACCVSLREKRRFGNAAPFGEKSEAARSMRLSGQRADIDRDRAVMLDRIGHLGIQTSWRTTIATKRPRSFCKLE